MEEKNLTIDATPQSADEILIFLSTTLLKQQTWTSVSCSTFCSDAILVSGESPTPDYKFP